MNEWMSNEINGCIDLLQIGKLIKNNEQTSKQTNKQKTNKWIRKYANV